MTIIFDNEVPVPVGDTARVHPGASVSVSVVLNDTDADGDHLSVKGISTPAHGSASINNDGTITYWADAGTSATTDSFEYTISDGHASSSGSVSITILQTIAVADSASTHTASVAIHVLDNDSTGPGTIKSIGSYTSASYGSISLNNNGTPTDTADDYLVYTPASWGTHATDSFSYTLADGEGGTSTATITIGFSNVVPVAYDDIAYLTGASASLSVDVLALDYDADGDTLNVTSVTQPSLGSASISGDGTIIYTPGSWGSATSDSFTYTIDDGHDGTSSGTVTISASSESTTAPVAADDYEQVSANNTLTENLFPPTWNDIIPTGTSVSVTLVDEPSNGILALDASGTFTYTPTSNWVGDDSFTYKLTGASVDSNTATVYIQVHDDAPVAEDTDWSVHAGTPLDVSSGAGLCEYSSDDDQNAMTFELATNPQHGTLTLNSDGSFLYTPTSGFLGTDTFTYTASDGILTSNTSTVTLTVDDNAPIAADGREYQYVPDTTFTSSDSVLDDDIDPDDDSLEAELVTGPSNASSFTLFSDGTFQYTPTSGYAQNDGFWYKASDGALTSPAVFVSLVAAPAAPAPQGGRIIRYPV